MKDVRNTLQYPEDNLDECDDDLINKAKSWLSNLLINYSSFKTHNYQSTKPHYTSYLVSPREPFKQHVVLAF